MYLLPWEGKLTTQWQMAQAWFGGKTGRLGFDAQTGSFTVGNTVAGATSGATGVIFWVDTINKVLYLINILGTFQDNEVIYESALGSELIIDSDNANFSDGTINEWIVKTQANGNGTCVYDAGPGGEKVAKITIGSTPGTETAGELSETYTEDFTEGRVYVIRADVYIPSTNNNFTLAGAWPSAFDDHVPVQDNQCNLGLEDEWQPTSYMFIGGTIVSTGRMQIYGQSITAGDVLYFDNISAKEYLNTALANGVLY